MEASILKSTKKILGVDSDYNVFDLDILTHINSAFSVLSQLGVGPPEGFLISDGQDIWDNFDCSPQEKNLVKTYIYLKVRMMFDPPGTAYLVEAANNQIKEYEWRLTTMRDTNLEVDV